MSGRGRGRGKKTNDQSKVKNPGVAIERPAPDDRSTDSSDGSSSEDSFDNIHDDEAPRMEMELEEGEHGADQGERNEDSALLRMSNLLVQIQQNQVETQNRVAELSGQIDMGESSCHTWKRRASRNSMTSPPPSSERTNWLINLLTATKQTRQKTTSSKVLTF